LLDQEYDALFTVGKNMLASAKMYSLTTDGWSNLRQDHLVNFVLIVPGQKPFFYRSIDTKGVPQSSSNIASQIIAIIEEIGNSDRLVSILTDNAANMRVKESLAFQFFWV
jgi:hypothetical protein